MATVMEFLHTATLVHDDIIDSADTRRNRPTVNALYGNETAVLMGDWLYMSAFETSLAERSLPILDILTRVTRKMTEGELLQLTTLGKTDISEQHYLDIIQRKTAFLFSACCEVGAILGGANETEQRALADYGMNLGMAFQLTDDLLDFTSRISSKEAYCSPTRGQQGNALSTILPMPFVLAKAGEEPGSITIEACGIAHEIKVRLDPIRQEPAISHRQSPSVVKTGTRIAAAATQVERSGRIAEKRHDVRRDLLGGGSHAKKVVRNGLQPFAHERRRHDGQAGVQRPEHLGLDARGEAQGRHEYGGARERLGRMCEIPKIPDPGTTRRTPQ